MSKLFSNSTRLDHKAFHEDSLIDLVNIQNYDALARKGLIKIFMYSKSTPNKCLKKLRLAC